MNRRSGVALCLVVAIVLVLALPAWVSGAGTPQWTPNGVPLRNVAGSNTYYDANITTDGAGGAIVTWTDSRSGTYDIYAQRVLADGATAPGWTPNGEPLRTVAGSYAESPTITSDGTGGAIVTWQDNRSGAYDIYAQRVLSDGEIVPGWTADGVPLRNIVGSDARNPTITSDGAGGAIITWRDDRSGAYDIYAQRVLPNGAIAPGWTANGMPLRNIAGSDAGNPTITSDGAGGAIVTWNESRSGVYGIYAQRVLPDGATAPGWTANGVPLRSGAGICVNPTITSDGAGGAVVTWYDRRSGVMDIYAQRVLSNGTIAPGWTASGVPLRNIAGSNAYEPNIASDGAGGAIVTWYDNRSGDQNIYAQRVQPDGTIASGWTPNGVPLRNIAGSNATTPTITSDGAGGAIVTWSETRSGVFGIYAQRVLSDGATAPGWTANGVPLRSIAGGSGAYEPTITSDGAGGAIVAWLDYRSGVMDVYAQKISTTYSIAVTQGAHGTITPAGTGGVVTVDEGAGQSFTITPDMRYHTERLTVDGADVTPPIPLYTFTNVTADHTITAEFAQDEPPVTTAWYLAEGTNAWGFNTYITIENPNTDAVTAKLTYMDPNAPATGKGIAATRTITLPPLSQTSVSSMNDIGNIDFSTKVECMEGKSIAVDRTMFWTGPGYSPAQSGYHSSIGATSPATTWYLPEGSSNWGFETWTLVENPNPQAANVTLTYMTEGAGPKVLNKTVPAYSRATYNMAQDIGGADSSIQVSSDVPVIAERSMYKNNRREGSCSIGVTTPANDYFLAEGATVYNVGFITYVLIQNPQSTTNNVTLTYQTQSGQVAGPSFTMAPDSRKTVRVNDQLPPNTNVSTQVHGSLPIIAERAMYWDNGTGTAFHASIGLDSPHMSFYLPDGNVSSTAETWTLVQNPNPGVVTVRVTYLLAGGGTPVSFTDEIPPNSRASYSMGAKIPSGRASIMVQSLDGARPIMVERSMYMNNRGGGTNTIGGFSD